GNLRLRPGTTAWHRRGGFGIRSSDRSLSVSGGRDPCAAQSERSRTSQLGSGFAGAMISLGTWRSPSALRPSSAGVEGTAEQKTCLIIARPGSVIDPGCVKTPKGRSRRGIVFYRRRGFRVVLQPLATTLVLEKKVILCVPHALSF